MDRDRSRRAAGLPSRGAVRAVGLVVLLLVAAVVSRLAAGEPGRHGPLGASPTASVTATATFGSTRGPVASQAPSGPVTPVVPGWTPVVGPEAVAYDVPPDWRVEPSGTLTGFEYHDSSDARLVSMHDVSSYCPVACPQIAGSARARAGFAPSAGLDRTSAAPQLSALWAELAGLQLEGRTARTSPTQTVSRTVAGGTVATTESTTLVTFRTPRSCQASTMAMTAVSLTAHGHVVVFVVWTEEGLADSVPGSVVRSMIDSLRPV